MHHRHITAEQDVRNELFALLASARETYLRDVIDSGKLYRRFVDDFINSHRYIDCDNVVCRNCHEMIIHVVRGILYDYQDYVRQIFSAGAFSLEDCMEMKRMYDTSEINSPAFAYDADPMATATSLSFECNFSKEQMAGIKRGFQIRVNNIRHVAVLFDALLERSYIQAHWQSVLARGGFLLSKDGKRTVSATSLSSALSATRNKMTSVAYGIRKAVSELDE